MKIHSLILFNIGLSLMARAQSPKEIIARTWQAQQSILSAAYHVTRYDTLVTNETRTIAGDVNVAGLKFRVHQEGRDNIRIFDGKTGYDLNIGTHQYMAFEKLPGSFPYNDGTQLIVKDLLKLDTNKAVYITLNSNNNNFDLTFYYADLKEYDVTQRRKTVTISQTTWLPIAVREHQETLGRVQDLYYQISDLKLNAPFDIDLSGYTLQTSKSPAVAANITAPATAFLFKLKSFNGPLISLGSAKGKVVLLDFWEVWCGPCVESLPKVESLYQKFHGQGLEVYGITHDSAQTEPARKLVQKLRLTFPVLAGTSETKAKYAISSLPTYILIGKDGRVALTTTGYSMALENYIKELLGK